MKNIYRTSLFPFIFFLAVVMLVSCNRGAYRDDVSCEYLSKEMCNEFDSFDNYSAYSEEDVRLLFDSSALFNDFSVIYSNETDDINEIGVFHSPDEKSAEELFDVIKTFIGEQQQNQKAFIASYAPREVPKLEAATAKRYGNYVIYAILDEYAQDEAFEQAKELLEK